MPSSFFSPTFNPARLMLGQHPNKPYVSTQGNATKTVTPSAPPSPTVLGPEAVRATGQGPYDAAYRQNLATYAGGNFQRPNGFLGFNPTGSLFGNPTGAGSAPVLGMPTDLLTAAMGGQAIGAPQLQPPAPAPQPQQTTQKPSYQPGNWQFWLKQYGQNGSHQRLY